MAGAPIAIFIIRWILGLIFASAGYWKIFERGVFPMTEALFIRQYADTWIPTWLLWPLGVTIPFAELTAGLLLCVGLFSRYAAGALGILLIITTYGHLLLEPLFDISGHTFNRLVLVLVVLMLPSETDLWSFDRLLARRGPTDE
jgi:uncharacterized membrane protein YphA (DoxX/SURF4 family)